MPLEKFCPTNARKGNKKLVDIELQYEQENDKTLLQLAVDEGKAEALQVKNSNSLRPIIISLTKPEEKIS